MTKITMDGIYTYANGEPARILCVDAPGEYPVRSMDAGGSMFRHDEYGRTSFTSEFELIEAPKFSEFKDGDPVMVRDDARPGMWYRRYFAYEKDGKAYCYDSGRTKWTSGGSEAAPWRQCRRPTEEELES